VVKVSDQGGEFRDGEELSPMLLDILDLSDEAW
jgi:hypothetical protein